VFSVTTDVFQKRSLYLLCTRLAKLVRWEVCQRLNDLDMICLFVPGSS